MDFCSSPSRYESRQKCRHCDPMSAHDKIVVFDLVELRLQYPRTLKVDLIEDTVQEKDVVNWINAIL